MFTAKDLKEACVGKGLFVFFYVVGCVLIHKEIQTVKNKK